MYGQLVRGADAGSGAYVRNIAFDKATGEIVEGRELTRYRKDYRRRKIRWILFSRHQRVEYERL